VKSGTEMRPLDPMAVTAVLLSWAALLTLYQDPLTVGLGLIAVVCAAVRGRVSIARTHWLIFSLAGLVISMLALKGSATRTADGGLVYSALYPVAVSLGVATYPALLRSHTRREYWGALCLSAILLMLCGLNLAPTTREFASYSALWTAMFCLSTRHNTLGTRTPIAAWLTLVPAMVLLAGIALAYAFSEHQVNFLLRLLSTGGDVSLAFPAQSRMNTMLNADTNPAVACRVFSQRPNRYLPARVYTDYEDAVWKEPEGSKPVKGTPAGSNMKYQLNAAKPLVEERFEVHSSPIVLFCPRDSVSVQVNHGELAQLSGHLLEIRGGGNDLTAYTVGRRPGEQRAPQETSEYVERCARMPQVDPIVAETARQVMGTGPSMQRAERLESWLQKFEYGFGYDYAASKDPVADFLRKKPKAHCEVFASAMTLMLRSQGIPCRYINGFAVIEQSLGGDYWVVRVRDAHAWVEVWDGQAWHTMDPTPPVALSGSSSWWSWFDSLREAFFYKLRTFASGGWREWLGVLWKRRAWFALLLVGLVLWKMRKLPWFPKLHKTAALQAPQHQWMRQLDSALEPHGLKRESWETVHHWSRRVEAWEHGEGLAAWLRSYSEFRYGGGGAQTELALGERLTTLLRELQQGLKKSP
jgi:hypothetical protein